MIDLSFPILLALALSAISIITAAFLFLKTRRLSQRLERLLANMGGDGIEETLLDHYNRFTALEKGVRSLASHHETTAATAEHAIYNVGMVRFNPFSGEIGGDQSFSLALLNGKKTGVVLTALHSREGTRIYAKPLTRGESEYNLSREEQRAIDDALSEES